MSRLVAVSRVVVAMAAVFAQGQAGGQAQPPANRRRCALPPRPLP